MNAIGGVPVKTSSASGLRTWCEKVSALSTSRWKCIVALGRPVVPEVNASMETSSAAVSTFVKSGGLALGEGVEARRRCRWAVGHEGEVGDPAARGPR